VDLPQLNWRGGIDGLFLRTDQTYLDFAIMKGKDLRPEHGGIGNTDQLKQVIIIVSGDNKNQGPSGEPLI
jgi:hypothetical protein